MQLARLIGRNDARSLAGGMMVAFLQDCGSIPDVKDWLNIASNSVSAFGPRALGKAGCISSGPAALFIHKEFEWGLTVITSKRKTPTCSNDIRNLSWDSQ